MIRAFSIVLPVLNKENEIIRTLESVEASIAFFFAQYDGQDPIAPEVVIVNEGSTDRTLELVTQFAQDKPYYQIINHHKSLGIGPARNTGVKISKGDIIFFCDGDDLYFKEHIYICFQVLNHQPQPGITSTFQLPTDSGTQTFTLPPFPTGVVRTGVYMQDALDPYWKGAIENTIAQNLCIRRDCHEFMEGFPEAPLYKEVGCEDISYDVWIAKFFRVARINYETVEYIRYPGNNFDRQLKKFQTPPEQYVNDTPPEQQTLHAIRHQLEQERLNYLMEKLTRIEKSPEFLAILNCHQLGNDYLVRQNYELAIQLLEQGIALDPKILGGVRNLLAAAYNNQGSILRGQGQLEAAIDLFKKSLDMNPTFPATDLAKVSFNVASAAKLQGDMAQALTYLQKSLALDPQMPEALAELPKLNYASHVQQKGYQFTQDWFSINVPVWEQFLTRFANLPDLRILEIGSWEGRSTCWLIDQLLTDPSARITCIDTFEGGVDNKAACDEAFLKTIENRFDFNIQQTGRGHQVRKMVGKSQTILRSLMLDSYQLAYIDGSHIASDVLEDTVLTWALVKVGGWIVFDDYGFQFADGITENPPKAAIDAFREIFAQKTRLIHQGYQVILEKIAD